MTPDIDKLIDRFSDGETLKFLFFWGHTNNTNEEVGKFCFSQWFELPFVVDGITYKTAEHWMMANKALLFNDLSTYHKILTANKPGEAKALGREVLGFDDQIWNDNSFNIVKLGNIHKFNQHSKFAAYLLSTGDRILAEASPVDKVWGIGLSQDDKYADNPHCWTGKNLLGFALMEVRAFLKEFGHFDNFQSSIELPWKAYPDIHPTDMRWRMGHGEDLIMQFAKYYSALSERDQKILELTNPAPYDWKDFY
jgi:ribA/ribD-fused uncharacterized protein